MEYFYFECDQHSVVQIILNAGYLNTILCFCFLMMQIGGNRYSLLMIPWNLSEKFLIAGADVFKLDWIFGPALLGEFIKRRLGRRL